MPAVTVRELIDDAIAQYGERIWCIERKRFRRKEWSYLDLDAQASRVAGLMSARKLQPGDAVGICAPNGPWWLSVYIAALRLGLVIVPIDVNSPEVFIDTVAKKTDMKLLFKSVYKPLTGKLDTIEVEQLTEILATVYDTPDYPEIKADAVLEIVFTSGSTGDPKGVVLTHRNVASNVGSLKQAWKVDGSHRLLSMIPLSHMFEQTVGFLVPFVSGSRVVYVESVRPYQIVKALRSEAITTIVTVPAFLALLRRRIMDQAAEGHVAGLLAREMKLARFFPRVIRRFMFQAIHIQLGGQLRLVAIGGAALSSDLEAFWDELGIHVLQGYGLTETAPIATYNSPRHKRHGSVGRSLPGQDLQLAEDGEILLAGDNLFSGYFQNDYETTKVLHDGWFHTGDVGKLDEQGYLYITGRKKNMLLTESGLNIYPEDIESQLANFPAIKDSVIMLLKQGSKEQLTAVVLTDSTEAELAKIVQATNEKLASHQSIQHSIIWPEVDFPRTPTRKVKRQVVIDTVQGTAGGQEQSSGQSGENFSNLQVVLADVAGVAPNKIQPGTGLVSDLGLDSLKRLELVSKIEEQLGAFLEESSINVTTTFAELEKLVAAATHSPKPKLFNFSLFESWTFSTLRVFLQWPLILFASHYQKLDGEKLPKTTQPVIYIANHTSHFDTITFLRLLPLFRRRELLIAAAQDYFFKNYFQACLLRIFMPLIPLDREGGIQDSLERMGKFLDRGYSLLLFPEGTRSTKRKQLPFKQGIGVMAQELEVPIVPLKLSGNDWILSKGHKWPKRGTTEVKIGQPLIFGKDGDYASTTHELEAAVKDL